MVALLAELSPHPRSRGGLSVFFYPVAMLASDSLAAATFPVRRAQFVMDSLYSEELVVFIEMCALESVVLVREYLEFRNDFFNYHSCICQNLIERDRRLRTMLPAANYIAVHVGGKEGNKRAHNK